MQIVTQTVQVRLTPGQVEAVRDLAAADARSVSEWLRELIRREISARANPTRPA